MASVLWRSIQFTVLVPGTVAGLGPAALGFWTGDEWPPPGWRWTGILPLVFGLTLYGWTAFLFAARGRGTPGPWDPPRRLIVQGPYTISRNPMYIAVVAIIIGQGALWSAPWVFLYGAVAAVVFHLRVILYEEPALARAFPEDWPAYVARVRRWI